MKHPKQLALDLCLRDDASFANFYIGENIQLVSTLQSLAQSPKPAFIYLWGAHGSGKSHVLAALCQWVTERKLAAAYLPLADAVNLDVEIFDDLENLDLLCIDDIDAIANNRLWEEAIFHYFNRAHVKPHSLVVTAQTAPANLALSLPDLQSRMASGVIFQVVPLNDEQKFAALQMRAKLRGIAISDNVAKFILRHYARDTASLFSALDKLDRAALAAKKRLTIPFVKAVLGGRYGKGN